MINYQITPCTMQSISSDDQLHAYLIYSLTKSCLRMHWETVVYIYMAKLNTIFSQYCNAYYLSWHKNWLWDGLHVFFFFFDKFAYCILMCQIRRYVNMHDWIWSWVSELPHIQQQQQMERESLCIEMTWKAGEEDQSALLALLYILPGLLQVPFQW